jgi:hypothetical protein
MARGDFALNVANLRHVHAAVQRGGRITACTERVDLILHQSDERRDDYIGPFCNGRRHLIAERLPAPGRHHHQRIAPIEARADRLRLQRPETLEAPESPHRREDFVQASLSRVLRHAGHPALPTDSPRRRPFEPSSYFVASLHADYVSTLGASQKERKNHGLFASLNPRQMRKCNFCKGFRVVMNSFAPVARTRDAYSGEGWCPTEPQLLLLKAALLSGDEAIDAWRQWISFVDIETLDEGSNRLLPLLSYNLDRLGLRTPYSDRLRGYRRQTWFRNQLQMRTFVSILTSFKQIGLEAVVLKGISLAFLFYPDSSIRPLYDIDLLVRREDALRAIALMAEKGWKTMDWRVARRMQRFFKPGDAYAASPDSTFGRRMLQGESIAFVDPSGMQIDLHWNLLHYRVWPGADDDFWSAAVDKEIGKLRSRILCPTDCLLHVLEHGSRWNHVPPIRWIADAMMIMRSNGDPIDWERLVRLARQNQLAFGLYPMLDLLKSQFGAAIPSEVMAELNACPTSWVERTEHRLTNRSPGEPPMLWRLWFSHLRWSRGAGLAHVLMTFPRHLQYAFDLRRMSELPAFAVSRTAFKVSQMILKRASHSQERASAPSI